MQPLPLLPVHHPAANCPCREDTWPGTEPGWLDGDNKLHHPACPKRPAEPAVRLDGVPLALDQLVRRGEIRPGDMLGGPPDLIPLVDLTRGREFLQANDQAGWTIGVDMASGPDMTVVATLPSQLDDAVVAGVAACLQRAIDDGCSVKQTVERLLRSGLVDHHDAVHLACSVPGRPPDPMLQMIVESTAPLDLPLQQAPFRMPKGSRCGKGCSCTDCWARWAQRLLAPITTTSAVYCLDCQLLTIPVDRLGEQCANCGLYIRNVSQKRLLVPTDPGQVLAVALLAVGSAACAAARLDAQPSEPAGGHLPAVQL